MQESKRHRSWGMRPAQKQDAVSPAWLLNSSGDTCLPLAMDQKLLPFGNGRSYGDSCLNSNGLLIDTRYLSKIISFDRDKGVICAEPGITLREIMDITLEAGWCIPVSPGTSFVTLGGAVANDVHGKNHHAMRSIGNHIVSFDLHRSSGEILHCSPLENNELFKASIGGLGLTGLISSISIQLMAVNSAWLDCIDTPFRGIREFLDLSNKYERSHQYTVAWLDCVSSGGEESRGIFTAANHCPTGSSRIHFSNRGANVPFNFPALVLNKYTIGLFNSMYFNVNSRKKNISQKKSLQSLFYPLDSIFNWNRIYGKKGFYQFQFVVPMRSIDVLEQILEIIRDSGLGSFLAVLKVFGSIQSPGMLSFPRPGICLALDFAYRDIKTERLLKQLELLVIGGGGAIYPAKDRMMSAEVFAASFPQLDTFCTYIDDGFCSDFWKRVRPAIGKNNDS